MLTINPHYGLASLARTALAFVQARRAGPAAAPTRPWRQTEVRSLRDAEDLLDSLEGCGFSEREMLVFGNSRFEVRWR